ncbi:MAG: GH3 auxin-responsive promoter family protein [Bacteroidia bacterium]|nr:GH3 auxin-responsive promoter family protein [Bacteroidia bacterium]
MTWLMKKRFHQIELFIKYPYEVQRECLQTLLNDAKHTEYGTKYNYAGITNYEQYKNTVPIVNYETLQPYINRCMQGEQNILWHEDIVFFAKSSGTTEHRSKYIPVSKSTLENCHYKGGKDMITLYCMNNENTQLFTGKNLALGGSLKINDLRNDTNSYAGDLSAIVMQNLPFWAEFYRAPKIDVALLDNWDEKLEQLYATCVNENIVSLSGVPSWMLVLCKHVLTQSGKTNVHELWPNVEVFFNGGINFAPYQQQFKELFPADKMRFYQLYSASEGFFGIQDSNTYNDMLLMLDYGVFYEFATIDANGNVNTDAVMLDSVLLNVCYALIITTNGGLWRYAIGDTIMFTSLAPHRFKIVGRTKHFINAFGEELMVHNADEALQNTCTQLGAVLTEYTAAPLFMGNNAKGRHEWLIEFEVVPNNIEEFTHLLDAKLMLLNSDYEAKRSKSLLLQMPLVTVVAKGTFYNWLSKNNKLGGQYKIPRLSNSRVYYEEILLCNFIKN